jgi:hypothetical protein
VRVLLHSLALGQQCIKCNSNSKNFYSYFFFILIFVFLFLFLLPEATFALSQKQERAKVILIFVSCLKLLLRSCATAIASKGYSYFLLPEPALLLPR